MGDTLNIPLYIIWTLFAAAAAAACTHALQKTQAQERRIEGWPKVEATVTGSRTHWISGVGDATPSCATGRRPVNLERSHQHPRRPEGPRA